MAKPLNYNKAYFKKRDHLDLHIAESIKLIARKNNFKRTLDVGCGTGKLVNFFQKEGFDAHGCDNQKEAILLASKINKKGTITKASATNLPFRNQSFDIITCISVIEHLTPNQAEKFLSETRRVLKPGSFIFLITPNFATPLRLIQGKKWFAYSDPTHVNFYTPRSLAKLLSKFGFGNFQLTFKTVYHPSFDWEFPPFFGKLPKPFKAFCIFLLFSTPLTFIRNSFWITAQKKS